MDVILAPWIGGSSHSLSLSSSQPMRRIVDGNDGDEAEARSQA